MRGEGIKGQADPAALKEFPECGSDRFFNSLDVQVEYAAEEDVVKVLLERVPPKVKDPEERPGGFLPRQTDKSLVDIKARVVDLNPALIQEPAKASRAAAKIEDLLPVDAPGDIKKRLIAHELSL